jgi:hypothetical protein
MKKSCIFLFIILCLVLFSGCSTPVQNEPPEPLPPLSGTIQVIGTARAGSLLTVDTSLLSNNNGILSYTWRRGTIQTGDDNPSCLLNEGDIGFPITVTVSSSLHSGSITSLPTKAVAAENIPETRSEGLYINDSNTPVNLDEYTEGGIIEKSYAYISEHYNLSYTIVLTSDVVIDQSIVQNTFHGLAGTTVIIKGSGAERKISSNSDRAVFYLMFGNLVLDGNINITGPTQGIWFYGSYLIMEKGVRITVNGPYSSVSIGVGARFFMHGGEISGNNYYSESDTVMQEHKNHGGAVEAATWSSFTMSGGEIFGNCALDAGGGIWVNDAECIITGTAVVRENDALLGGGIAVSLGKLSVTGNASVSDNTAYAGAGIHLENSSFEKNGGSIIRNLTDLPDYGGNQIAFIYDFSSSNGLYRDADLGPSMNCKIEPIGLNAAYTPAKGFWAKYPIQLEGLGTQTEPYLITTVNEFHTIGSGSYLYNSAYQICADMTIHNPNPGPFAGTLDGRGNKITLNLNAAGESGGALGIFAVLNGATIRNLVINGTINVFSPSQPIYAGALAGQAYNSNIQTIASHVSILAESPTGGVWAGGITGQAFNLTVADSYSSGNILAVSTAGLTYAGGITGSVGSASSGSNITINRCFASGNINAEGSASNAAGILGLVNSGTTGAVNNCAALNGSLSGASSIGRIAGRTSAVIMTNNYANSAMAFAPAYTPVNNASGKDGASISIQNTGVQSWWQNTLHWSFGSSSTAPWSWAGTAPELWFE